MTESSARVVERRRSPGGSAGVATERRGLLAELQRRNVIRMAGLYLVAAWLITQVSATVLPLFEAPTWVPRSVVVLLALAFIPTLIFSWVFELTPDGIKRDSEIAPELSIAPVTGRRMDRMIIAVLALALGYFCFDRLVLAPRRDAALVATTTKTVEARTIEKSQSVDRNSIAVLPFVNMSGDPANDYFSDGISEEILNVLAGTPALRVAARTSSFSFKGKPIEVPEIARALKVRMVLEGSVRKQGDRVRITAQLIDAGSGFHEWAQTYDRKLEDVFAIQDEIAKAIGDELMLKIGGVATPGQHAGRTRNVAAYDLYLRGMALWHARGEEALLEAVSLFEQAVEVDPGFAQAYAGLALANTVMPFYSAGMPFAEALARSDDFALRALALDPGIPEPYAAMAVNSTIRLQRSTAISLLDRAIALRPSFATAHQWRGRTLMSSGELAGGLESLERATTLDPRSLVIAENRAWIMLALGRNADARAGCLRVLAFAPEFGGCLADASIADLLSGDLATARQRLERLAAVRNPGASGQGRELTDALEGHHDRHAVALRIAALPHRSSLDLASGNALEDYQIPVVLMLLGEEELTLDFMDRISREMGNDMAPAIMLPALDPIRCEPRFRAIVARLKTTDPHFAKVCQGKR